MEDEVKQIMLDKLKEMSKLTLEDCGLDADYVGVCKAMNEIAKTLIESDAFE